MDLNGNDVNFYAREDGTTGSFLKLVCETQTDLQYTRSQTETATKCGIKRSKGPLGWTIPIAGIVKTDASASEVSYEQLQAWMVNGTDIEVKIESPTGTGTDFYHSGTGFLQDLNLSLPSDGFASFTGTVAGTEEPDIIP